MSSAAFFRMEIPVPEEARALVIGKGGQTIKGFQKSPGISCARLLPSGTFQIRGDSREAVQKIASSVGQLTSRAVRSKSTGPAFYRICFCKSIKNPLLAVDKISFEKFPATTPHISEEDGQHLCFRSGEEGITHSAAATSYSDDLAAAFSSKASLSNFFNLLPHWDFSGYKTELLSCIKFLRSEERDAMRTVKMIVRFGKEVFQGPSCGELQDGGFVSLSYLQRLFNQRHLTHRFSTACSDNAVRDLGLNLENHGYVKVSIQKKISIHASDREKLSRDFNISVRCIGNESSLPNREVRRILSAKDYFQVLGVGLEASLDEIGKAFRRCLLKIEFQTGDLAAAEAARKKAMEASDCLLDSLQRARYLKYFYPASKISSDSSVAPLPAVPVLDEKAQITRVRREPQRHGIVSFCREGRDATDFRLAIHSYGKEMEIQKDMVEWVERAWGSRTPDQLFVFDPTSRYEVMNIRYKQAETFVTEDFKFRIARVLEGKEGGQRQSKRWECALSSRWAKWNDGIVNDRNVDSIAGNDVITLIDEAVKFSELMTAT